MLIDDSDMEFIRTKFPQVEGWCEVESAYFSICILNKQMEMGCGSALLEIGVYKGKYLSVLYQKARRTCLPLVGIDTFQWSSADEVTHKFEALFGSTEGLSLVQTDSRHLDAPAVLEMMGGRRASFISVDGDHAAAGVESDLQLAQKVLHTGGIVAVDDFLNPRAIGVSEGTYRFLLESAKSSLRPFAYCANKLYLAEAQYHERYAGAFWALVAELPDLPMIQGFNHWLQMGRGYVEQELMGSTVVLV